MTGTGTVPMERQGGWHREELVALYADHRDGLVRLATLLLGDVALAEDVVQDAYVKVFARWSRIRDDAKVLAYLRRAVVNTARSAQRRRTLSRRHETTGRPADVPSAEESAHAVLERDRVVAALRQLPRRQREAVVLRYYGGLKGAEIAAVMGCGVGSVKAYLSRGIATLTNVMRGDDR